jgi:hypothetical protein
LMAFTAAADDSSTIPQPAAAAAAAAGDHSKVTSPLSTPSIACCSLTCRLPLLSLPLNCCTVAAASVLPTQQLLWRRWCCHLCLLVFHGVRVC